MYKSSVEAAYFCLWLAGDLILVLFLNPTKLQLFHVNHMMMAFPARRTSDTPELSNWLCWLGYLAILRYFYLSIRYWTWYLSYYLYVSINSSNVKSKGEHPSFLLKAVWEKNLSDSDVFCLCVFCRWWRFTYRPSLQKGRTKFNTEQLIL